MATKTKNIADLSTISGNSASLLGKTPQNVVGYIAGLLDAQGNIAGLSDIKDQLSQFENLKQQFTELTQNITELQETVGGFEETTNTIVENAFNERITIKGPNGTSYMNNEESGGIIKFTKNSGEVGKVTIFDGTDGDGTYVQIVAHNQDKSNIAKINFTVKGAYYSKENTTTVAIDDNELVTKKDVRDIVGAELLIDQTYNSSSENAQSGKAVAEAIVDLATKSELAEKAAQSDLDTLGGRVDALEAKPDITVDQSYNAESTNPQSGTAVAEALKDVATNGTITDLQDRVQALEEKPEITVDQTYDAESANPQSGTAVAEAVKDLATKTELSEKADQTVVQSLTERIETVEAIEVDQTYNAQSTNAQSGKAVAEAINNQRIIQNEGNVAYMSNETSGGLIKFTKSTGEIAKVTTFDGSDSEQTYLQLVTQNGDKSKTAKINFTLEGAFYAKTSSGAVATADNELLTKKDIKDLATKTELAEKADQSTVDELESKLPPEASGDNQLADKQYVDDMVRSHSAHFRGSWPTKADIPSTVDDYPQDINGSKTPEKNDYLVVLKDETHDGHTWEYRYAGVWDTNGVDGWTAIYEISDSPLTQAQFDALDSGITKELVDQIGQKANQSDLDDLSGRVDTLEAIEVDQTFNGESTNAQSGTAVAEAIDKQRTIQNGGNVAYMSNETSGGLIKFTKVNGEGGKITTYDGSDSEGTYVQISTFNQDKSQVAKLNFTLSGAYYSKESSGAVAVADNEILTKKDIKEFATKTELTAHTSDTDIHTTAEEKTGWSDKYTKAETDGLLATKGDKVDYDAVKLLTDTVQHDLSAHMSNTAVHFEDGEKEEWRTLVEGAATKDEVSSKASQTAFNELEARVDILEAKPDITVDQSFDKFSENPQSGIAVQEAIKDFVDETKFETELLKKADKDKFDTLKGRVDAMEAKPDPVVDQMYDEYSTNAQSGTAVANAIATLATKEALGQHTGNNEIHVTMVNKNHWDDKYTKSEVDEKLKLKVDSADMTKYVSQEVVGTTNLMLEQIYAHDEENSSSVRLNIQSDGIFYTKNAEDNKSAALNEILTKADIQSFAPSTDVTDLQNRVQTLEEKPEPTVDQTYSSMSENAQSGKAVAQAVSSKAESSDLTSHTSDTSIHVTSAKQLEWDAKVSTEKLESVKTELQELIDEKVASVFHYKGQVANYNALPLTDQKTGDVYNVEDTGANYVWSGTAWDKLSEDAAGAEALQAHINNTDVHVDAALKQKLSDLYTKEEIDAELAKKGGVLDYESFKQTADTVTNELATHIKDTTLHFDASEKATVLAKLQELENRILALEEKRVTNPQDS